MERWSSLRKLATAAATFSAAIFAAYYLVSPSLLWIFAPSCAALSFTALFFKGDARLRVLLVTLAAAAGFGAFKMAYENCALPAQSISGQELIIEARVTEYPMVYDNAAYVPAKLIGDNTPKLSARLCYYHGQKAPELRPGDIIRVKATLRAADTRFGRPYSGLTAQDIWISAYVKGETEILSSGHNSLRFYPKRLAQSVKALCQAVFPERAAALMTGLLTGDTKLLYADALLYAQMAKAGILHVVAVSGMNVAFLVGFIRLLVRRKRAAAWVSMGVIAFFVPFAGATPSVIRAACMYLFVLLAPLFGRQNDSLTSLTTVLAVMLAMNPYACASVSLQLSFAATLGILTVTPRIYRRLTAAHRSRFGKAGTASRIQRAGKRVRTDIDAALASTLGAIVFSTPVSALYFGYVSLIGILVNLLIFWAITAAFLLGYFACAFGALWLPAGKLVGSVAGALAAFIIAVVRAAASVPYGAVYTQNNAFGWWLLAVYAIFIIAYLRKGNETFRFVTPSCIAVSTLCCLIVFTELASARDTGSFTAVDVGQGECLVMTDGKTTVVTDCGGSGKLTNAGDIVASWLLGQGRETVDILALTHFDDDHCNGVERLMARCRVRCLVIPAGGEEHGNRQKILDMAQKRKTQVYIIEEDTEIRVGALTVNAYSVISQEEQALLFLEKKGAFEALIPGDTTVSDEQRFLKSHELPDAEVFVASHHGSKHGSSAALLTAVRSEYALVSSGYNSYGHPSPETLKRLQDAGMIVLRTDTLGNITIPMDTKEQSNG
jgi:competence protein ComEC